MAVTDVLSLCTRRCDVSPLGLNTKETRRSQNLWLALHDVERLQGRQASGGTARDAERVISRPGARG